jgi:prepilin-type N-terminal cleavage/methylation domain-containing protein
MKHAHAQPADRPIRGGYTLIEVLIVVIILGIASAVIVPSLSEAGSLGLQGAARLVIADILYAQNEAIASGQDRGVVFDVLNNRYRVVERFDSNNDGILDTERPITMNWKSGDAENYVIDFNRDQRFKNMQIISARFPDEPTAASTLWFNDLGAPETSTDGGVVELGYQVKRIQINVSPLTGRVTVTGD